MEPSNSPQSSASNNLPQPVPVPDPSPQQPVTQGYTPPPVMSPRPSGSNKKGLLTGIICAFVAVIVIVGILGYMFVFSSAAAAQKTSTAFMKAITTKDVAKALSYTDATDSTKQFLESAATASAGGFKLIDNKAKDGKRYYLYELTGATSKSARTTLEMDAGKWRVSSYVHDASKLAVIPGSTTDQATTAATNQSANNTDCLAQKDFDPWYMGNYHQTTAAAGLDFSNPNTPFTGNVHFKPDSLDYVDTYETGFIEDLANLAKQTAAKQFTIRLKGSVGTTAKTDLDFANQRADKVRKALVDYGVPPVKIVVEPAGSVADFGQDQVSDITSQQTARSVVFIFDPTCSTSTKSGTGQ